MGFEYKSNIVWHKLRKDGGSDGRGVGFYFRNVTEILLFGVRGRNARTLPPGRSRVNYIGSKKREHSRKPDEQYDLIESCSPEPFIELIHHSSGMLLIDAKLAFPYERPRDVFQGQRRNPRILVAST